MATAILVAASAALGHGAVRLRQAQAKRKEKENPSGKRKETGVIYQKNRPAIEFSKLGRRDLDYAGNKMPKFVDSLAHYTSYAGTQKARSQHHSKYGHQKMPTHIKAPTKFLRRINPERWHLVDWNKWEQLDDIKHLMIETYDDDVPYYAAHAAHKVQKKHILPARGLYQGYHKDIKDPRYRGLFGRSVPKTPEPVA